MMCGIRFLRQYTTTTSILMQHFCYDVGKSAFGLNYSLAELSETHDFKIGLEYFVFLVSVGAAFGETSFGVMCGGS